MEKNKLVLTLSAFLLLVFAACLVSAGTNTFGVTFDTPNTTSIRLNQNWSFNVTIAATYTDANVTNCSFYAKDVSTNATSYAFLFTEGNLSAESDQLKFGYKYNTTALEDGSNYTFKVICVNVTTPIGATWVLNNITNTTNVTGVFIVNNTIPTVPTSVSPATGTTTQTSSQTFTATVTDAKTTGCRLFFGNAWYNMTYSGSTCTYSLSNIPAQVYMWDILATDGADKIYTAQQSLDVRTNAGGEVEAAIAAGQLTQTPSGEVIVAEQKPLSVWDYSLGGQFPVWLLALIIVVIVIAFIVVKRR